MIKNRYVVDTNVFISRLLLPHSIPAKVLRYILDEHILLTSDEVISELEKTINKSKFDRYITAELRKVFLDGIKAIGHDITVSNNIYICRDHNDNKIIELAYSGKAKAIITGDQDLLVLKDYKDIAIITPQSFLKTNKDNK